MLVVDSPIFVYRATETAVIVMLGNPSAKYSEGIHVKGGMFLLLFIIHHFSRQ